MQSCKSGNCGGENTQQGRPDDINILQWTVFIACMQEHAHNHWWTSCGVHVIIGSKIDKHATKLPSGWCYMVFKRQSPGKAQCEIVQIHPTYKGHSGFCCTPFPLWLCKLLQSTIFYVVIAWTHLGHPYQCRKWHNSVAHYIVLSVPTKYIYKGSFIHRNFHMVMTKCLRFIDNFPLNGYSYISQSHVCSECMVTYPLQVHPAFCCGVEEVVGVVAGDWCVDACGTPGPERGR